MPEIKGGTSLPHRCLNSFPHSHHHLLHFVPVTAVNSLFLTTFVTVADTFKIFLKIRLA